MGSRRAPNNVTEFRIGYAEVVNAPKQSSVAHTGYAEVVNAPKQSSASSTAGSGKPAAKSKEPSNNSIYKDYGGYMNFLHCHGLRVWNPEDVDEGHAIVSEIKSHMRGGHETARAPAKTSTNSTGRRSTTK